MAIVFALEFNWKVHHGYTYCDAAWVRDSVGPFGCILNGPVPAVIASSPETMTKRLSDEAFDDLHESFMECGDDVETILSFVHRFGLLTSETAAVDPDWKPHRKVAGGPAMPPELAEWAPAMPLYRWVETKKSIRKLLAGETDKNDFLRSYGGLAQVKIDKRGSDGTPALELSPFSLNEALHWKALMARDLNAMRRKRCMKCGYAIVLKPGERSSRKFCSKDCKNKFNYQLQRTQGRRGAARDTGE